ncbi:Guanylate cyclase [Aphelenchoides bicaudatus]|nr:Guanylate cyclase [Aphelenchoides bicaudatus]
MKPVWEESDSKRDYEDVIYMVKKGGRTPLRPTLDPVAQDISPALHHLIRDCWAEDPSQRPKIETVFTLLKSMNTSRNSNLIDHVFQMLENYAANLEEDVEQRTKELVEEKKKSDLLLYRMLPKQVAEKLKIGQSVEPESFDKVTVFFSDVVSFTTLAAKCTPLQTVNLLNDLYTTLDSIIAEYDVYKVETIGDGYLCVSGLPHRNGNEHARHIANMALNFIRSIKHFTIPHLPGQSIALRIGLHSGPCVAGVVGLAMPRYCLFGDSVNTASRMESGGRVYKSCNYQRHFLNLHSLPALFICTVPTAYTFLEKQTITLRTCLEDMLRNREEKFLLKEKASVMETFWLLGMQGDPNLDPMLLDNDENNDP